MKKFTTKELVFLAILTATLFVFDVTIVMGIKLATGGIEGAGLVVDTILLLAAATIAGRVVPKFGTFTIVATLYTILLIPLPLVGPPGVYKVGLGLALGIMADVLLWLFRYCKIGYYVSLPAANILSLPLLLWMLIVLGLPGVDEMRSLILVFAAIVAIESLFGVWAGMWIYEKKLRKSPLLSHMGGD